VRALQIVAALLEWGGRLATSEWTGYWMDANGNMTLVDDHIGWARRYVLKTALPSPKNDAEYEQAVSGVYTAMSKLGWLKITVEFGKIFIQPTRATRTQMAALQEFAIENHLPILDQQTGRTIFNPKEDQDLLDQ